MRIKNLHKFFSFLASVSLLLNYLLSPFAIAYAQEASPTASPEVLETSILEPTVLSSEEPTTTPTPLEEPTTTPTPFSSEESFDASIGGISEVSAQLLPISEPEVEKVCLSDEIVIEDTKNEDFNIDNEKGTVETKEKVKLGVKYIFPLENKVTITFKCLPKDESLRTSLKIQQIKVSDLKLPDDIKTNSEYAYDITTGMSDGTFEFDLTLPKPENSTAEVSYIEKTIEEVKTIEVKADEIVKIEENKIGQEGDKVKASSIDHFTIFVVTSPNSQDNCNIVLASTTPGSTCFPTIQQAILAAAVSGDTIWVADGTYEEYLSIENKSVNLKKSGSLTTIIKPTTGSAAITLNNVTGPMIIQGFIIDANNVDGRSGIYIQNGSSAVTIEQNNIINFTDKGVLISNSNDNVIENNDIKGAAGGSFAGIYLDNQAGNNTIDNNRIILATVGSELLYDIWFSGSNSKDNIVKNNTINGGTRAFQQDSGVSGTVTFSGNNIGNVTGPSYAGIYLNGGSAIISENTIKDSVRPIEFWGANNITITNNILDGTTHDFINIGSFTGILSPIKNNAFLNMGIAKFRNQTGNNVNATENYWGDSDPSNNIQNDKTGSIDYSPWWGNNYIGDNHSKSWTWYTNDSIKDAINLVSATVSDTINVVVGTYIENGQIIINKNLSIVGADKTTTIIKPSQNTNNVGHADSSAWILVNSGISFNLSNITLDGNGKLIAIGILSHGHGTINNNILTNIAYNQSGPDYKGMAIELYGSDMTVSNNSFSNIGRIGVFNGFGTNSTVSGNTYIGKGVGTFLDYGFEVGRNGHAIISNNIISNNKGVASDGSTSAGILVTSYYNPETPSQAVITGNTISNSTVGVAVGYADGDLSTVSQFNTNTFSLNDYDLDNHTASNIDARNNTWSVSYQNNLDQIEAKISHYCSGSTYVHGACSGTDDYGTGFGMVQYKNIGTLTNSGWNVRSMSATPNETPLDVACGGYTNENSVAQNWTAVNGTNIKYQREVTYPSGAIVNIEAGSNAYTPFSTFGSGTGIEGLWKTKVRAYVDANGNNKYDTGEEVSEWSNECGITFDKTAPDVAITAPTTTLVKGNIEIRGTVTDANPHHYWLAIYKKSNGQQIYSTTVNHSNEFTDELLYFWNTIGREDGEYQIKFAERDAADNRSPDFVVNVTLDNTAPTITTNNFVTNDNTPKLTGTVNDNTATISVNVDGKTFTATNKGDGTWELANDTITPALSDNTYNVIASATDTAGNIGTDTTTNELTVDTVAPTATYKHYIDGIEFLGLIAYVNDINKLTFTGEYSDAIPSSQLLKDSYVIFDAQADGSFKFSQNGAKAYCNWRTEPNLVNLSGNPFSLIVNESFANCKNNLGEGEYYMTHQVYDNAVRKDIPSITQFRDVLGLHFIIDTINPSSIISSPANDGPDSVVYSSNWDGTVAGTANDDIGVNHVELSIERSSDNAFWSGTAWIAGTESTVRVNAVGTSSWSYILLGPTEDSYTIRSHAVDNAGNMESSYKLTIVLDKTIPQVDISLNPVDPDASNGWYKTQPEITLKANDNNFDKIQYQWDSQTGNWTTYVNPFKPGSQGSHILYYRARDKADNYSEVGIKNIKWDETDLTEGPLNINVSPNPTSGSTAVVKWDVAKDNIGIDKYEVKWSLKDGDKSYTDSVGSDIREHTINNLIEGNWSIQVTAFDASGNSKSNSTDLTVDQTNPSAPTLSLTGTGEGTASLSWTAITDANDYIIWYGNAPGSRLYGARVGNVTTYLVRGLSAGNYYFIVRAVDAAGNQSSESNEVNTGTIIGAPGVSTGAPAEGFAPEVLGEKTADETSPSQGSFEKVVNNILGVTTKKENRKFVVISIGLLILAIVGYIIYRKKNIKS